MLVLGGTGEGHRLAEVLGGHRDLRVVTSLAGRTTQHRPEGEVHRGGFGGAPGLARWLHANAPAIVVDATHPFAVQITRNALAATELVGCPLLRLQREAWRPNTGDRWLSVPDVAAAADLLPDVGQRPLVTTGRLDLAAFTTHPRCSALHLVARCVEPPTDTVPARTTVLLARGPYTVSGELDLLRENRIDVLVTKNSGGEDTRAKLDAARDLGLPVIMIDRPLAPRGLVTLPSVAGAGQWVLGALPRGSSPARGRQSPVQ